MEIYKLEDALHEYIKQEYNIDSETDTGYTLDIDYVPHSLRYGGSENDIIVQQIPGLTNQIKKDFKDNFGLKYKASYRVNDYTYPTIYGYYNVYKVINKAKLEKTLVAKGYIPADSIDVTESEDDQKENNIDVKYAINKSIIDKETGEVETVKLNKYNGHQTTKYNNITVTDYFVINGLRHAILSHVGKETKYVIREDGEVFSLNEKGEWKLKAQHFCESGGVKNRARREAGRSGGSVYKCVCLWSKYKFLTHKLVKDYVTHEKASAEYYCSNGTVDSIVKAGKHTHVGENFYKGCMPVDFGKRCYKA